MLRIVGFSGSLRAGSYNTALLRAAQQFAPSDGVLEIASIAEIPLYNFDVENSAFPQAVSQLKDRIAAADGLLISTPEYNNSIPGVAKNVIDWLSRPADDADRVFKGLPVATMGTSPSRFGTVLSQNAWLSVLRTLETRPYFEGRLVVPNARKVFDESGAVADPKVLELLAAFIQGFFEFARAQSRQRV
jgi:chromate reductase, NAD(P)H dehydrogenase (quinone)